MRKKQDKNEKIKQFSLFFSKKNSTIIRRRMVLILCEIMKIIPIKRLSAPVDLPHGDVLNR